MFRYADDWIITVRGTKAQAQEIKEEWKHFLQEELGLELSEEKTVITHIIDGLDFLGYHIFRCNRNHGRQYHRCVYAADRKRPETDKAEDKGNDR